MDRKNILYRAVRHNFIIKGPSDINIENIKKNGTTIDIEAYIALTLVMIMIGLLDSCLNILELGFLYNIIIIIMIAIIFFTSICIVEVIIHAYEYHKIIKHLEQKENKNGR